MTALKIYSKITLELNNYNCVSESWGWDFTVEGGRG